MKIIITENQLNILEKYINNSTSITEQVFLKKLLNLGLHELDDDVVKLSNTLSNKFGGSGDDILKTFANTLNLIPKSKPGNYKFGGNLTLTPKKLDEILVAMRDPNKVDALLKTLDNYKFIDSSGTKSLSDVLRPSTTGMTSKVSKKGGEKIIKNELETIFPKISSEEIQKNLSQSFDSYVKKYSFPSSIIRDKDIIIRNVMNKDIIKKLSKEKVDLIEIKKIMFDKVDTLAKELELVKNVTYREDLKKLVTDYIYKFKTTPIKTSLKTIGIFLGIFMIEQVIKFAKTKDIKSLATYQLFTNVEEEEKIMESLTVSGEELTSTDGTILTLTEEDVDYNTIQDFEINIKDSKTDIKELVFKPSVLINGQKFNRFIWDSNNNLLKPLAKKTSPPVVNTFENTIEDFKKWFSTQTEFTNLTDEVKNLIDVRSNVNKDFEVWFKEDKLTNSPEEIYLTYTFKDNKFIKK